MTKVIDYFKLVKFAHTIFAMPFAMIGFSLGIEERGEFSWVLLLCVIMCMVFARNTAMGFNRYADYKIDSKNPRTKDREIPAGKISPRSALIFVIINALLFILTTYFINDLVFYLSPVAIFVVIFYSYTKKFTSVCHFVLGLSMSLAPLGAYLSVVGEFKLVAILYSLLVLTWGSGFDIIYSLQDIEFDVSQKLHSIPERFGKKNALIISSILHIISSILVLLIAYIKDYGIIYSVGASIFLLMLYRQHKIVKPNDLSKVNVAFLTLNGIASVVFAVFNILEIVVGS